jgi:hypothetical protein
MHVAQKRLFSAESVCASSVLWHTPHVCRRRAAQLVPALHVCENSAWPQLWLLLRWS